MNRARGAAAALVLVGVAGCATVGQITEDGPRFYGGTRFDVGAIFFGATTDVLIFDEIALVFGILDLPFSFVLDTAMFPVTLPYSLLVEDPVESEEIREVLAQLADDDTQVYERAIDRLDALVERELEASEVLVLREELTWALSMDPHPRVRTYAARALGAESIDGGGSGPELAAALTDADPDVREAVAATLEQVDLYERQADVRAELFAQLDHELPEVRAAAVGFLTGGQLSAFSDVEAQTFFEIHGLLSDASAQVRGAAARGIGKLDLGLEPRKQALEDLARVRDADPEPEVRRSAVEAIKALQGH